MVDDRNENNRERKSKVESIDHNEQWWLRFVPNSKQWSDVNISRFLNIYKAHPILWDPTHSFYEDQPRRMETYTIISRRLNLHDINNKECIELVESLKDLYAAEKKRQTLAKRCAQKYTPPPAWYCMLEDMVGYVQQKLANPAAGQGSLSIEADPAELWKACCPRLYTEDIWTPKHFKTNVMDWFLIPQDERLLCTCKQFSETTFDDNSSTETSSIYCGDSSSEINQCVTGTLSHSSKICCSKTLPFKLPRECGVDVNNDEIQTCNSQKLKKNKDIESFCKGHTINEDEERRAKVGPGSTNTQCLSENTRERESDIRSCSSEAMYSELKDFNLRQVSVEEACCGNTDCQKNIYKTDKECKSKKRQHNIKKKLVLCENNEARMTICTKEHDVLDVCGREAVDKPLGGIHPCPKNNEISNPMKPQDTCSSDSNTTPVTPLCNSRHNCSLLSDSRSLSKNEESDHRLDFEPDPTLCPKCAMDRVPVREVHANVMHFQDPRMSELDKYCRYKDWDGIYNIRTQVPDEEPVFQIEEDLILMIKYKDEPLRPKRQNHIPIETDINVFIDPKSFEEREVSLNNEYKREYGLHVQNLQPRHHVCVASQIPGYKSAQLIL